jgi:hypothetical protein
MALKADRYELQTDISFFYNAGVATRGGVVCHDTAGSGAAMDQGVNLVKYATTGVPVGVLLNDVVNKDLTRTHLNQYKDEVQKGGKVTVLRKGYVVTNSVDTTIAPVAGSGAYRSTVVAGNISMVASGDKIGAFLSSRDADGYCKVEVSLP